MLVTLPCVLLLLDFWPLKRLTIDALLGKETNPQLSTTHYGVLLEKLPFFALAVASSIITFLVQKAAGAVSSLESLPIGSRISNALLAYIRYLSKTFWPTNLAAYYPHSKSISLSLALAAVLLLAAISAIFIGRAKRNPYLIVGWLWFLGTLFPTIGIIQVGTQSMADRYTYLPSIGLFILVIWGVGDLLAFRQAFRPIGAALSV